MTTFLSFILMAICIEAAIMAPLGMVFYWLGHRDLKSEKAQYDAMYSRIEGYIKEYPSGDLAFKRILLEFIREMELLRYRNPEKTEVLKNKILLKYKNAKETIKQTAL